MARKRMIDIQELVFDPDLVQELKHDGLLVYEILWGNADDFGGFELNLERIKLWCGALKLTTQRIESILSALVDLKKVIPYEVQGKRYIWLKNFMKHQPIKNPSLPTIPLPEWVVCETKQYPSGKKYANYVVVPEKLPVDYQYPTSSLPVVLIANRIETNRIETTPETTSSLPDRIQEFLGYFNQKTGKKYSLTPERKRIIEQRLATHSLEDLKKAVDNFVKDDWSERHKYTDVIYCIGIRNKIDNLEKWLNYRTKAPTNAPKAVDRVTNLDKAKRLLERERTTTTMIRCLTELSEDNRNDLVKWIQGQGSYLKPVYQNALKILQERVAHEEG